MQNTHPDDSRIYRRAIQDLLPTCSNGSSHSLRLVGVLYVVVETGIIYSILWIIFALSEYGPFGLTGIYWADHWIYQVSVRVLMSTLGQPYAS